MRTALVVLALAACVLAVDYTQMFNTWMAQNGKHYKGAEYQARLGIFTQNAKFVERHNSEGHSFTVELNKFAAMTNEEFSSLYLMPARNYTAGIYAPGAVSNVDWRTSGAVTPVKDQGQCGSCWTFSTTGGLEGCRVVHSDGKLISLSEQQLVDCSGLKYGNLGCNGGTQDAAMNYIIDVNGLETEADYPYTAKDGTCTAKSSLFATTLTKYQDVTKASEAALQGAIVLNPVPVSIDASGASFQLYKDGVYCPSGCSSIKLDHAVLAVGMNTADGGYYIVKNSWGTSWGMEGYLNMCADNNNNCGIATAASYPVACSAA